jgi:hypothetical protein
MWSGNLRQRLQGHRVQPTDPVQGAEHVLSFLGANCTIDNGLVGFTVRSHSAKARWKSMIRSSLFQALKVL